MPFNLQSGYLPSGDQPKAIEELSNGILDGERYQTLLGVTGSGKTFTMANVIQKEPYLWLFYELVRFHVEFMVLQLIKDFKKEQ